MLPIASEQTMPDRRELDDHPRGPGPFIVRTRSCTQMSFNQIFSRLTRIARSYGSAGHDSSHDDLRRAQQLIDEARSREDASRWEAALAEEEDQTSYRRACTTLELRPGASLADAALAYRRIIMTVHPDRTVHLPER